jgi:KDO2-lipid IV(A) lauroyltransferase
MIIDQNTIPQEGVVVDFFSHPVTAIPSVSQLHLKKDIPICPVFLHYEPDRIVCEILDEVVFERTGDFEADVQRLTQDCHAIIEDQIRLYPEQWFWFHNRWKARPQGGENAERQ